MKLHDLRFDTIAKVLTSWEMARQTFVNPEVVSLEIMLNLLQACPDGKKVLGVSKDVSLKAPPHLEQMPNFVHSNTLVAMLDGVLSMLGPDLDMLEMLLAEQAMLHKKRGLSDRHFSALGDAVRNTLLEALGSEVYTESVDLAWRDMFVAFSFEMTKSTTEKGSMISRQTSTSDVKKVLFAKASVMDTIVEERFLTSSYTPCSGVMQRLVAAVWQKKNQMARSVLTSKFRRKV